MTWEIELPTTGFTKRIEYLKVSDSQYAEYKALPDLKSKKKWITKVKASCRFEFPNVWESYRELSKEVTMLKTSSA